MTKTMSDVLVDHQRHNSRSCLCGWDALGKSHPEHQEAMLMGSGFGPVGEPVVVHVHHDTEAHARSFNEGYEAAVTQGLSDDPTLADDWFQGKLREAAAGALRDAADELAKLQYVRPDAPDRAAYLQVLAVRRGNTDAWLRARATAVEGGQ